MHNPTIDPINNEFERMIRKVVITKKIRFRIARRPAPNVLKHHNLHANVEEEEPQRVRHATKGLEGNLASNVPKAAALKSTPFYEEVMKSRFLAVTPLLFLAVAITVGGGVTYAEAASIPDWIKNVAGWWAEGRVSDAEYFATLSYLANEGFFTMPEPEPTEPTCDELFSELYLYSFAMGGSLLAAAGGIDVLESTGAVYVERHEQIWDKISEKCPQRAQGPASLEMQALHVTADIAKALVDAANAGEDVLTMLTSNPEPKSTCSLFCDTTGYEPQWAKSMGQFQAQMKCLQVMSDAYGTPDSNWCIEFNGYIVDQIDDPAPESTPTSANFDFDIIKCASDEFGWFTEIKVKAVNLSPHGFESIKFILGGKDASGNIVDFTSDYEFDVRPGATLYLDSMIDDSPEIRSCFVEIESYD